jgi:hypothetical protein
MSDLAWPFITMPGDYPGFIIKALKKEEFLAKLLDSVECLDP